MSFDKIHANARNELRDNRPVRGTALARYVLAVHRPFPAAGECVTPLEWERIVELALEETKEPK